MPMARRTREPEPPEEHSEPRTADELASFESMMAEIERITASLERGDLPLQESLASFERASLLSQRAQRLLEQAEARLTRLVEGGSGEVIEVAFALEQTGRADEG